MFAAPAGQPPEWQTQLLADLLRAWADRHRPADDMVIIGRRDVRSDNRWMRPSALAPSSTHCRTTA